MRSISNTAENGGRCWVGEYAEVGTNERKEISRSNLDPILCAEQQRLGESTANLNNGYGNLENSNLSQKHSKKVTSVKCASLVPRPKHLIAKKPRPL